MSKSKHSEAQIIGDLSVSLCGQFVTLLKIRLTSDG